MLLTLTTLILGERIGFVYRTITVVKESGGVSSRLTGSRLQTPTIVPRSGQIMDRLGVVQRYTYFCRLYASEVSDGHVSHKHK